MSLYAFPPQVRADATSLLVLLGPPDRAVTWSISGSGSLTILSDRTDAQGRAYARYHPGTPGDTPTVSATYGA